jgi:ribonuclease BN (tRNA processing enzyme)
VHGEPTKLAAVRQHLFAEEIFPVPLPCQWEPLTGDVRLGGRGRLSFFSLQHPGGSLGFRLDWPDRSLAYVTDTVADLAAGYVEKIRGVDVLLHECYFPDAMSQWAEKTGHSWTSRVAAVAAEARVGRLILVHLNPLSNQPDPVGLDDARRIFPNTELGFDRMEVEVTR